MPRLFLSMLALALTLAACGRNPSPPAAEGGPVITLALVNGRVWTGNPSLPSAEAIAIAGDRIVAVGSSTDVRARAKDAPTIDLAPYRPAARPVSIPSSR